MLAGPRARAHLREHGLRATDVRAVAGAAGGPKGLVLNPLDRFVFGHWLLGQSHPVHLLGASIGAWRMACACRPDADAALAEMAEDYIEQRYEHKPGRAPAPSHVSAVFSDALQRRFGGRESEVLSHPGRRLHVFTSRGKGLLAKEGRIRTPVGYFGAFAANLLHRKPWAFCSIASCFLIRAMCCRWLLHEYPTHRVSLDAGNLAAAILASCSIPFWLDAVHDIAGALRGAYWDGGITDYHMHLAYASLGEGLRCCAALPAHPGAGLADKPLKRRHARARGSTTWCCWCRNRNGWPRCPAASCPTVATSRPMATTPMRACVHGASRSESQRMADEFERLVSASSVDAEPLP